MDKIMIVGAGLSGATLARLLAESGKEVTLVDRRTTVGGNAYDYVNEDGIIVQSYGPHIFHTNYEEVYKFLSKFTEWIPYEHRVLASIKRKKKKTTLVPVPFNLTSLFQLYDKDKADFIKETLIAEVGLNKKVPILQLKNHKRQAIRDFADFVYKNIFYIYTMKQWGFKPEELGEQVMNRVPVYVSEEDRYFTDTYQFMPKDGFTVMIKNMLSHPKIKIRLGEDANKILTLQDGEIFVDGREYEGIVVHTGCIDELFGYKYGILPYRSLKFKFITKKQSSYQDAAVVNYTTNKRYTRISEFTKFTCEKKLSTVIVKEYSKKFKKGKDIPYYPIPIQANFDHYAKYKAEADKYKKLYMLGRLANYKYINMDVAVKNAMDLFEEINSKSSD